MHLFHRRRETFNCLLASIISILCYNVAADALKKADALLWFAPYETLSRYLAFRFFSFPSSTHLLFYRWEEPLSVQRDSNAAFVNIWKSWRGLELTRAGSISKMNAI